MRPLLKDAGFRLWQPNTQAERLYLSVYNPPACSNRGALVSLHQILLAWHALSLHFWLALVLYPCCTQFMALIAPSPSQ